MKSRSAENKEPLGARFPAEQIVRLRRIHDGCVGLLSRTQERRCRAVMALILGLAPSTFRARLDMSHNAISNLKSELLRHGLEPFLQKWERVVIQRGKKRLTGAPGLNFISDWVHQESVETEPVVELARMLVGPHFCVAIFAVSEGKCVGSNLRGAGYEMKQRFLECFRKPARAELSWTEISLADQKMQDATRRLRHFSLLLDNHTLSGRLSIEPIVDDDYPAEFDFFSLEFGQEADHYFTEWFGKKLDKAAEGRRVVVGNKLQFWDKFESIIYELRERWSCPGLFPSLWFFYESVAEWSDAEAPSPFHHRVKGPEMNELVKHHQVLRHYLAHFGGMLQMAPKMWRKLPWREEFPFETKYLRPRVDVKDGAHPNERHLLLHGIPELGQHFTFTAPGDSAKMASDIRNRFREFGTTIGFHYSNRKRSRGYWAVEGKLTGKEDAADADTSLPTVLLARHFLAPTDHADWTTCSRFAAARFKTGSFRAKLPIGPVKQSCLVFNSPRLIKFIRRAFQSQWYGDEIHRIYTCQTRFAEYLTQSYPEPFPLKSISMVAISGSHPLYWAFDLKEESKDPEDQGRLQAFFERHNAIRETLDNSSPPVPLTLPLPGTSFLKLFKDCDADFLLLGISPADRRKIDAEVDAWIELVKTIIGESYAPEAEGSMGRIIGAVPELFRKAAGKRRGELHSWAYEILQSFANHCRRVTRFAIETAQRMVLAGQEPKAIVIETEDQLKARWSGYLGAKVKGKLTEGKRSRKDEKGSHPPRPDRKSGETDTDVDATADYSHDIFDIREILEMLIGQPDSPAIIEEFCMLAEKASKGAWMTVLDELSTLPKGEAIKTCLSDALQLCKSSSAPRTGSEAKLLHGELSRCFRMLEEVE